MMTVEVVKSVCKEAKSLPKPDKNKVDEQIDVLEKAKNLYEVPNVVPVKGTSKPFFRLKFGNYRFIMYYDESINYLKVLSLTHRKDTYKKQNLPWRR